MIRHVSTILGFSLMMFLSSVEGRSTSMHSNPPRSGIKFLVRNFLELFARMFMESFSKCFKSFYNKKVKTNEKLLFVTFKIYFLEI